MFSYRHVAPGQPFHAPATIVSTDFILTVKPGCSREIDQVGR